MFTRVPENRLESGQAKRLIGGAMMYGESQAEILDPVVRTCKPCAVLANVRIRRTRQRVDDLRDKLNLCWRERVQLRLEFREFQCTDTRFSIRSTKDGFISTPTHRHPNSWAASKVVPDPAYGSKTTPSVRQVMATHCLANDMGIIAGWSSAHPFNRLSGCVGKSQTVLRRRPPGP